mmetsp:Transcript_36498/g.89151  ORF Transcript_36498/g.89151 Transcript_36498/m.89151 type:complete len:743 (+) Transcript_36498:359-2587(+)
MSPYNAELVFFQSPFAMYWTHDGGATVRQKRDMVLSVLFHPTEPDWLLEVRFNTDCNFETRAVEDQCFTELWLSQDGGDTDRRLTTYVRKAAWGVEHESIADKASIVATVWPDKAGGHFARLTDRDDLALVESTDFFQTQRQLAHGVQTFVMSKHLFAVATVAESERGAPLARVQLQPRINGAFVCSRMPRDVSGSITLYPSEEFRTLLAIVDVGNRGVLLRAGAGFTDFEPILEDVGKVGSHTFEVAFTSEFTIIANQRRTALDVPGRAYHTVITHDFGTTWTDVPLPAQWQQQGGADSNAARQAARRLLLTIDRSAGGSRPLAFLQDAPALVVAHGKIMASDAADSAERTFLSRDYGFTWEDLTYDADGGAAGGALNTPAAYSAATSFHGSIMVFVAADVDHVALSYDEGATVVRDAVTLDAPLDAPLLAVPWGSAKLDFIVYDRNRVARDDASRAAAPAMYHVDFGPTELPDCVGFDKPNTAESDYELAYLLNNATCVFGARRFAVRRKRRSLCTARHAGTEVWLHTHCECDWRNVATSLDFECNVGFRRIDGDRSKPCELDYATPPPGCEAPATYNTTVYRKVAGNECSPYGETIDYKARTDVCPAKAACDCSEHGTCVGAVDGTACAAHCVCDDGWFGKNCEQLRFECSDRCQFGPCITLDHCIDCRRFGRAFPELCEDFVNMPGFMVLPLPSSESGASPAVAVVLAVLGVLCYMAGIAMIVAVVVVYRRKRMVQTA